MGGEEAFRVALKGLQGQFELDMRQSDGKSDATKITAFKKQVMELTRRMQEHTLAVEREEQLDAGDGFATVPETRTVMLAAWQRGPVWAEDEKVDACLMCTEEFHLFRRRHHCRNCGGVFCNSCCESAWLLSFAAYSATVPVCIACHHALRIAHEHSNLLVSRFLSADEAVVAQLNADKESLGLSALLVQPSAEPIVGRYQCVLEEGAVKGAIILYPSRIEFSAETGQGFSIQYSWIEQITLIVWALLMPTGVDVWTVRGHDRFLSIEPAEECFETMFQSWMACRKHHKSPYLVWSELIARSQTLGGSKRQHALTKDFLFALNETSGLPEGAIPLSMARSAHRISSKIFSIDLMAGEEHTFETKSEDQTREWVQALSRAITAKANSVQMFAPAVRTHSPGVNPESEPFADVVTVNFHTQQLELASGVQVPLSRVSVLPNRSASAAVPHDSRLAQNQLLSLRHEAQLHPLSCVVSLSVVPTPTSKRPHGTPPVGRPPVHEEEVEVLYDILLASPVDALLLVRALGSGDLRTPSPVSRSRSPGSALSARGSPSLLPIRRAYVRQRHRMEPELYEAMWVDLMPEGYIRLSQHTHKHTRRFGVLRLHSMSKVLAFGELDLVLCYTKRRGCDVWRFCSEEECGKWRVILSNLIELQVTHQPSSPTPRRDGRATSLSPLEQSSFWVPGGEPSPLTLLRTSSGDLLPPPRPKRGVPVAKRMVAVPAPSSPAPREWQDSDEEEGETSAWDQTVRDFCESANIPYETANALLSNMSSTVDMRRLLLNMTAHRPPASPAASLGSTNWTLLSPRDVPPPLPPRSGAAATNPFQTVGTSLSELEKFMTQQATTNAQQEALTRGKLSMLQSLQAIAQRDPSEVKGDINDPQRRAQVQEALKSGVLAFLLDFLPAMQLPPVSGETQAVAYTVENLSVSDFRVDPQNVEVEVVGQDIRIIATQAAFRIHGCQFKLFQKGFPYLSGKGLADIVSSETEIVLHLEINLSEGAELPVTLSAARVSLTHLSLRVRDTMFSPVANLASVTFSETVRAGIEAQLNANLQGTFSAMVLTLNERMKLLLPFLRTF